MEISVTKLSRNGQIVIPSEIRNAAKLKPSTKFIVLTKDGDIILKKLNVEDVDTKLPETKKKLVKKLKTAAKVYA
jgi:AbrB family looped-hinge helix DNA binding protein